MKSMWKVLQEQIAHFYLVRRLSIYDIKSKNQNNYLGIVWEVLTPVISIRYAALPCTDRNRWYGSTILLLAVYRICRLDIFLSGEYRSIEVYLHETENAVENEFPVKRNT